MDAPTDASREGRDESTPTPTRKAQVANLREKRSASDAASVTSEVTVLKVSKTHGAEANETKTVKIHVPGGDIDSEQHEPSMQALSDVSSTSGNDVFTTHGLQLALNSTVRLPSCGNLTEREVKGDKYRTDCSDHHDKLLAQLDNANEAYETIAVKRDRHNHDADPANAATLNREFFEANNRLSKAEREYHGYVGYINELRAMPQMTRSEAKLYHERKRQERQDRQQEDEKHKSCNEQIRSLKRQAQKDQDTIAYLKDQLHNQELEAMRGILAQRREITEMSEQNRKLAFDAAKLTTANRDLKCLNGFLTRQNESFESHPGYCNPAWEDPNAEGVQNAMAARQLVSHTNG